MLQRAFHLEENQTTVRRELLAGLTTFMTMAYVVVVNPQILSEGGMPVDGVLFATCISSAVATLIMGLWANYPIALAPGMSLNAYFTYSVCLGMHIPWRTALGVVFISGFAPDADWLDGVPGAVFLGKPFAPADLLKATGKAIARAATLVPEPGDAQRLIHRDLRSSRSSRRKGRFGSSAWGMWRPGSSTDRPS